MNDNLNHLVNSRALTTFSSIATELALNPKKNYLFELPHFGALTVQGEKTVEFLQGQLTADIAKVTDIQMIQAAQCNLKGRILALMDVINWNGIKLILPQDILEQTKISLSKTALLSRVTIEEHLNYNYWGFYFQNAEDIIPNTVFLPKDLYAKAEGLDFCYYHLGDGFYVFMAHKQLTPAFTQPFIEQKQLLGSLTWHTLRLSEYQLTIYPESRGLFLPHRLDLHQTHYLSFDKGCYKGQEIIARTHYKATLKHELRIYQINTTQALSAGQKLFKVNEDIELGELVDYSILDDAHYLIAVSILKDSPLEVRIEKNNPPLQLEPPTLRETSSTTK
jgi:tRNA-modifying protein YgfZ